MINTGAVILGGLIGITLKKGIPKSAAAAFGDFMSASLIADISYVGSALIFCVGVPALLIPAVYSIIQNFL